MGFNVKWRSWIYECLRTATVSVMVNGIPSEEISIKRRLRQGDPFPLFYFSLLLKGLIL